MNEEMNLNFLNNELFLKFEVFCIVKQMLLPRQNLEKMLFNGESKIL